MRIVLIADIHGNLPALNAVLAEIAAEPVDQLVCLGDVAATGPQPREVLQRLRELGCPVVMGNADATLLAPPQPSASDETTRRIEEISVWGATQLSPEDKSYILHTFQPTIAVSLPGDEQLLCYHGSPRSFDDRLLPSTDGETLDSWFTGHAATLYAGGHTHTQMLVRHHRALVLNPGSVGLPFDTFPPGPGTRNPAWSEYAVVTVGGGGPLFVEFRRTPFDLAALLAAAQSSGMPHAAWWASDWDAIVPRE